MRLSLGQRGRIIDIGEGIKRAGLSPFHMHHALRRSKAPQRGGALRDVIGQRRLIHAPQRGEWLVFTPADRHGDLVPVQRRTEPGSKIVRQEGLVARSEEHTSELQSLMRISYAVFCLKKKTKTENINTTQN